MKNEPAVILNIHNLLPCPFCNNEPETWYDNRLGFIFASCTDTLCPGWNKTGIPILLWEERLEY